MAQVCWAVETQSHIESVEFQIKRIYKVLEITVVVGSVAPHCLKETPHVIDRAVPLSLILTSNMSPLTGVPVRFVVMDVIATASAVIVNSSVVSVLTDGVALDATVFVRMVTRLLVSVSVVARPTRVSVEVGIVRVPVLTIVDITGAVRVLLVRVCVFARKTNVSDVPAMSGIVCVEAPVVCAASETVTVCAAASAAISFNAPEVLPLT